MKIAKGFLFTTQVFCDVNEMYPLILPLSSISSVHRTRDKGKDFVKLETNDSGSYYINENLESYSLDFYEALSKAE